MTIEEFKIQYALGALSDEVKKRLATDLDTLKEILIILSKDENWEVRGRIAKNPNTPKEILNILSINEDWVIKYWVTNNPGF